MLVGSGLMSCFKRLLVKTSSKTNLQTSLFLGTKGQGASGQAFGLLPVSGDLAAHCPTTSRFCKGFWSPSMCKFSPQLLIWQWQPQGAWAGKLQPWLGVYQGGFLPPGLPVLCIKIHLGKNPVFSVLISQIGVVVAQGSGCMFMNSRERGDRKGGFCYQLLKTVTLNQNITSSHIPLIRASKPDLCTYSYLLKCRIWYNYSQLNAVFFPKILFKNPVIICSSDCQ